MYAAYEALSDKMQRMLSDLVAIHDTARTVFASMAPEAASAVHPVVRRIRRAVARVCLSIRHSPHQSRE
jgi:hypothetical protein